MRGETTLLEEASTKKKRIAKGAMTLFAIKMLVDDDMLYYLMDVKAPKEAWDTFASIFSKKPKPMKDKLLCGIAKRRW